MSNTREMVAIPIAAAKHIADKYGYDQVIVVGRRVGMLEDVHGEHCTTYGIDKDHCDAAAACGRALQRFMGWREEVRRMITPREHDVVQGVVDGLCNKEIAKTLGMSSHTVKFHLNNLMTKFDVDNRTALAVEAIRFGAAEIRRKPHV